MTATQLACVTALLSACSVDVTSSPDGQAADSALPTPVVYSLHFGPFPVPPGEEGVVCLDAPGPTEDVWVSGWHAETHVVHHANVFVRTSGDPVSTPTPCAGGADLGDRFFGTSASNITMHLGEAPEYSNVSLKLPAAADLLWDIHYLNTGSAPENATVDVTFFEATDHSRPVETFSFNGGKDMAIPPGATQTLTYSCAGPTVDTPVLTMSSHVHAHNIAAALAFGGKEVYRSVNWSEPLITHFDSTSSGALAVRAGQGATWSCTIRNTTTTTLRYANEIQTGEMCIFAGFLLGEPWRCQLP